MELVIFLLVLGLAVGSFLGVVVDRLFRGKTIFKGRSKCDYCGRNLEWYDLIPLLSFLFLRRKCRYCKKRLSIYYPVIEITTGVVFVITYLVIINFQLPLPYQSLTLQAILNFKLIYYLAIVSSLIVVFFSDLKYGIIPDKILIPSVIVVFLFNLINFSSHMLSFALSAIVAFVFFLFLFLITKGKGMGFGDVKFAFVMGLLLGFPGIIVALYMAFLTGAAVSIILILWKGKRYLKRTIPFGPFLALATFISLFWGNVIWEKILSFL
jgi:prepilin signal peptidase PulO-like enzyme (type II secretory pathway)